MNRLFVCRMRNKKHRFDQGSAAEWAEPCRLPSCVRTARADPHQAGTQCCAKNIAFHIGTRFVKGIFPSKRAKWLTKKEKAKPTNRNLSASKFQNFICNFTNSLVACINFYGIKYLIHTNPSDTSVNDIGSADSAGNIGRQPISQVFFVCRQRNLYDSARACVQIIDDTIDDGLFMHNPAEYNVFISSTAKKAVQQIANIAQDHFFCFFRYLKRISIPTPVTVQENTVGQIFFQLLADCCFANTHCTTNQIQCFHTVPPQIPIC